MPEWLTYSVQAILLFGYIIMVDRPGLLPDLGHIDRAIGLRAIRRYASIITFTSINSVTIKYIDSILVGQVSISEVAVYSVAAFVGLVIEIPLTASERISSPAISHALANKDLPAVQRIYYRSARGFLLLGGLMFLLVVLNVKDALGFLPEGYADGAMITLIIALGALVNMATGVNHPILINSDRYIYGSVFMVTLLVATLMAQSASRPSVRCNGCRDLVMPCKHRLQWLEVRVHPQALSYATVRPWLALDRDDHRYTVGGARVDRPPAPTASEDPAPLVDRDRSV